MPQTDFYPHTHGFAFVNAWTFSSPEHQQMQTILQASMHSVSELLRGNLPRWVETVFLPVLRSWASGAVPENYGLCGGMASTALDYYLQGRELPRGRGRTDLPTYDTPEGAILRSYLMRRQLDSMALNFPKLLFWMVMLQIDLPFIREDGSRWLLHRSMEEWLRLQNRLDRASPWPLMLIGTARSPFDNHQVLAYGYDNPGDGTGTIFIYDMNCPDVENTLRLDFRYGYLRAEESCPSVARGPLCGFFCNAYTAVTPP